MTMKEELLKEQQLTLKLPSFIIESGDSDTINLRMPVAIVDLMDKLIRDGTYKSRSQIMRIGIRRILNENGLLKFLPNIEEFDKYDKSKLRDSAKDFLGMEV